MCEVISPHVITFMHKDNLTINDILKYLKKSLNKIMTAIFFSSEFEQPCPWLLVGD
jgi:hypothetical protein